MRGAELTTRSCVGWRNALGGFGSAADEGFHDDSALSRVDPVSRRSGTFWWRGIEV